MSKGLEFSILAMFCREQLGTAPSKAIPASK